MNKYKNLLNHCEDVNQLWNEGRILYEGKNGVNQDFKKAFKLFEKAAGLGSSDAENMLGFMYQNGQGVKKDEKAAFDWYVKCAEHGNARGMSNAGWCLLNGIGTDIDYPNAIQYLEKAMSRQSYPNFAPSLLGEIYEKGMGVESDLSKAFSYYLIAADQGNDYSQNQIDRVEGLLGNEARVIYEEASKSGNKLARKNLDEMEVKQRLRSAKDLWERGRDLASKEPVKAEELLLKALTIVENELEAGYANVSISISESGFMSATGLGVNVADALGEFYCHNGPDYKKAAEYYKKAVYKFGDTFSSFRALERLFERIGDTKSLTSLYISKLEYALNPRPGHFIPDFVEGQHETMLSIMQNLFAEGAYGQAVAEYKKYSDLEDECDHYAFSDYDSIRLQEAENNLRVYLKRLAKEVLR